MKSILLHR